MQPITDTTRALLAHPALEVSAGAELLTAKLELVTDISDDLAGGVVKRSMHQQVHGTCELRLSRQLAWGVDLVRPYMVLAGPAGRERYDLGVYALTTPTDTTAETPRTYQVQGYDRVYLLDRKVGRSYSVAAGVTYRQALLDTFTAAGLTGVLVEGSAADSTLPVAREWPLVPAVPGDPDATDTPVTWLRVINDLLRAINYRGVWADPSGTFRCSSYQPPANRGSEFTWDADVPVTPLGEERTVHQDVWQVPNRWVFLWQNKPAGQPAADPNNGDYAVDNLNDGPTSQQQRGLVWTEVYAYEAASLATLRSLGDRRVALDRQRVTRLDVSTVPFPAAGHYDVFTYRDVATGGERKVQAVEWTLPLDSTDMTWTWEVVG